MRSRRANGAGRAIIDATPLRTHVKPFVGMGGVFLRRTRRSIVEVINSLSSDVATLYRVLQRHYLCFIDMLLLRITNRAECLMTETRRR